MLEIYVNWYTIKAHTVQPVSDTNILPSLKNHIYLFFLDILRHRIRLQFSLTMACLLKRSEEEWEWNRLYMILNHQYQFIGPLFTEGGVVKKFKFFLPLMIAIGLVAVSANATMLELGADSYTKPDTWTTVASVDPINVNHDKHMYSNHDNYMYWVFNDQNTSPQYLHQVDIVFHNIYNPGLENNSLNLYLADYDGSDAGWSPSQAIHSPADPDWSEWTHLGTWSDTDGDATANDIVFSITGEDLAWLTNGNQYVIGIDPSVHYLGDELTMNVPEPTVLFLLGTGFIGLLCIRPKIAESKKAF